MLYDNVGLIDITFCIEMIQYAKFANVFQSSGKEINAKNFAILKNSIWHRMRDVIVFTIIYIL